MAAKQQVAVLGGGIASIVAAYELTSTPELRAKYDVTVYQLGWRLGGKCASGRNAKAGQRIEEHGLHIWFGFYENAFRVMRDAYEELGRPPEAPLATWRDAFKECDQIVIYDDFRGRWIGRSFDVPRNPLTPGDSDDLPHFWAMAHEMLRFLLGRWGGLRETKPQVAEAMAPSLPALPFGLRMPFHIGLPFGLGNVAGDALGWLLRVTRPEQLIVEALRLAEELSELDLLDDDGDSRSFFWEAIDEFKGWLWRHVVEPHVDDDDLRFFFQMFDAGTTILQGILEDDLIERGFDSVNDEDLRQWLRRHGAQPITVDQSPFVRSLYDMAFAYERGDIRSPNMAAGTAVQDMLRLFFTYRGAFAWKMQAGMGDTVFTPFYEVLKRRGVRFEFFHWVDKLHLSPDRQFVESIDVIPQVHVKHGAYKPLVDVKGLPCWPSEPAWDQLVEGKELEERGVNLEWEPNPLGHERKRLKLGEHFDQVVLGIPVGALEPLCEELIADPLNPRFKTMVAKSSTVMTQAFQLWMNRPLHALRWPFRDNSIMTGYVEPLDTYANMSHLINREEWPPYERVDSIAYFCGVLPDHRDDDQKRANERARESAIEYLERDARVIWPGSGDRRSFGWRHLVGGRGAGPGRFDSQFWIANWQPTERYVITPAGSVQHRLAADESGYENLFLAGDWVKTGLDAGCVEAAVMSGMQASRAICGVPQAVFGEDHAWLSGRPCTRHAPRPPAGAPAYVNYGGLATCPSPVDCDDSRLFSFFLEADYERLDKLCDDVFAKPSRGAFDLRPLGRHVMLSFGVVGKIKPRLEPWSRMGYARERQVAIWIPVVAVQRRGPFPIAASLGWFVPYMWVDNPLSLAGGREIYGYNKNLGRIRLPANGDLGGLSLQAYGGNYSGGQAGWRRLMEVDTNGNGGCRRGEDRWNDLDSLVGEVQGALDHGRSGLVTLPELEVPDEVFAEILGRSGPPQIFLRQFRSVSDGVVASQQQITDGGVTVKRLSGRPLLGDFEFKLHHLDSHPLTEELGVESQTTHLAFEIEMDFVLNDGRVLWQGPVA